MKNYLRYVYAILAVPVIVLTRFALMPLIGPGTPYVTLFPVSVAVAFQHFIDVVKSIEQFWLTVVTLPPKS